jgi:hypothetical protein
MMLLPAVLIPSGGSPADHLPLPRRPLYDPTEVVYLGGGEAYDGGSFITYTSRRGWSDKDICDPSKSGRPVEEIVTFFQTWLFWGLLTDVLRIPIHERHLVGQNKWGQLVITTKHLPELILRWFNRDQYLSPKAQKKYAMRVDRNLWCLCSVLDWWGLCGTSPFDHWTNTYLVMLGEYLAVGYKMVYRKASCLPFQMTDVGSLAVSDWYSANRR